MADIHEVAVRIVDKLVADLSDRRGIGDEWDEIDRATKEEIKAEWTQIVELQLAADTIVMGPGVKEHLAEMKQNPTRVRNVLETIWNGED